MKKGSEDCSWLGVLKHATVFCFAGGCQDILEDLTGRVDGCIVIYSLGGLALLL